MKDKKRQKRDKWYHRSVVYHIYPRSFKDSNGNGIGDISGIINKLDYLNGTEDSLGIKAIWLSPIYKSPMADFGYDVSDYYDIDPLFGNLKDFDKLVKEAHKRDIKIIMDLVINHTSEDHPWFVESRSSRDNPKRDWYIWQDPQKDGSPPNNWLSVFGGPAWTYDKDTGQYYFHSFLSEQPDLNWRNDEVKAEMKKVSRFWLNRGVDGFRIDAIEHLVEDEEFRNDPANPKYILGKHDPYQANKHIYSKGHKDLEMCVNSLCDTVSEFGDKFIVSEAYIDIPKMMRMYKFCDKNVHAPFNFNLMHKRWSASSYKKFIDDFETALLPEYWPNYVFGNHDRKRLASRLDEGRAKIAAMLLLTLRGMPFIYYGDEIGMVDGEIPEDRIVDPFAIRTNNPNFSRDPQRTPMQWSNQKHSGFSESDPWLPVSKDYKQKNVESQKRDPSSLFNLYRTLIQYRNKSEALMIGSYWSLDAKSKNILSYIREHEGEKILVMLNFTKRKTKEALPVNLANVIYSTGTDKKPGQALSGDILLGPDEGCVFEVQD